MDLFEKDELNLRADSHGTVLSKCAFERNSSKKQRWRRKNKTEVAAFIEQETSGWCHGYGVSRKGFQDTN